MIIEIDPKVDFAFKRIFGSSQSPITLLDLLNAVLRNKAQPEITSVNILDPFDGREYEEDKLGVLDIRAIDELGQSYNIEMQMHVGPEYPPRAIYYLAGIFRSQIQQGEDYTVLKRTMGIHFVDAVMFPKYEQFHWRFSLLDSVHPDVEFSDSFSIHVLELPKFKLRLEEANDPLTCWLFLLKYGLGLDTDDLPASFKTPAIQKALMEMEKLAHNPDDRRIYDARLHAELTRKSEIVAARLEGEQLGLHRGRNEGRNEGRHEGEVLGLARGYREAIEDNLRHRFPDRAPGLLPYLATIVDPARLKELMRLSSSVSIEEFEAQLRAPGRV